MAKHPWMQEEITRHQRVMYDHGLDMVYKQMQMASFEDLRPILNNLHDD